MKSRIVFIISVVVCLAILVGILLVSKMDTERGEVSKRDDVPEEVLTASPEPTEQPILNTSGKTIKERFVRDLQQCTDSVIRLYGEYFYETKQYHKMKFQLVGGFSVDYEKWKQGMRVSMNGD